MWVSDYDFRRALAYRILSERVPTAAAHTGGPGLLISGQLRHDGSIDVQPVFPLDRAVPAAVTHPNGRIEGLDADGVVLFSAPLESQQMTDGPEGAAMFAVAVSAAPAIQDRLARLRVTVAGHQVVVSGTGAAALRESPVVALRTEGSSRVLTWSAGSYPGVMVRDRSTGEVVGFGSNGVLRLPRSGHLLDVIVSDGLHGRAVPVQP